MSYRWMVALLGLAACESKSAQDARPADRATADARASSDARIVDGLKVADLRTDRGPTSDARGDTVGPGCPSTFPGPCATEGLRCPVPAGPGCGALYECLSGQWTSVAQVPCTSCPATSPTGYCQPATSGTCIYGLQVCTCAPVCSGVRPPPGKEAAWHCAEPRSVACPSSVPQNKAPCTRPKLVCQYGFCGGSTATCTDGTWSVVFQPPPP